MGRYRRVHDRKREKEREREMEEQIDSFYSRKGYMMIQRQSRGLVEEQISCFNWGEREREREGLAGYLPTSFQIPCNRLWENNKSPLDSSIIIL